MTEQEFNEAKFIVETHRGIHAARQKQEWRVLLTTLTFYVVTVGAILSDKVKPSHPYVFHKVMCGTFILLALAACWYFERTAKANEVSLRGIAEKAENRILESGFLKIEPPRKYGRKRAWVWECLVVALGAFVASLIILFNQ